MSRTSEQVKRVEAKAPAWCEVADDGASWKCIECGNHDKASTMVFFALPNGGRGIAHKTCMDADWMQNATKVEGTI